MLTIQNVKRLWRDIGRTICIAMVLSIVGCANQQKPEINLPVHLPETFSDSGNDILPEKWWLAFNDPQLNELIDEAMEQNFSILSAWDRLNQAEQIAVKAGTVLLPGIDYRGSVKRNRNEIADNVDYLNNYSLGLVASYELDLWGAVNSTQQAAMFDVKAERENVSAAAITLSAAITKTWYQLAEVKMQEILLKRQIETNQQVLKIITLQFNQGQVAASDVFRQRQLVESTRGQLIQARENNILLQHQLSVLLGHKPDTYWKDTEMVFKSITGSSPYGYSL